MKRTLNKLDLDLYEEKLENGLTVYVIPKTNVNNIYATFTTQYGSMINEFVPIGQTEMKKYPNGIAHFLEHKVFEQKDGVDPFAFYESRGVSANANTTSEKTTYLFSGVSSFEENLNYLLDFVQSPYFTEENTEKEKGIIKEELDMYQDDPFTVLYEKSLYNTFSIHPIRFPVGGTAESIMDITKDMLYECYHTFYHPSNMFLVVTGNVNPDDVFCIVKENQKQKTFGEEERIEKKLYQEPDEVYKKMEVIPFDVVKPKVALSFKVNIENIHLPLFNIRNYLFYFFQLKLGVTSLFDENLKKEGIIHYDIGINLIQTKTHIDVLLIAETDNPETLVQRIIQELQSKMVEEEDLERKKKSLIATYINMSDSIFSLNNKVIGNLIYYKEVFTDDFSMIKNLNAKECNEMLKQINLNHTSTVILRKEN